MFLCGSYSYDSCLCGVFSLHQKPLVFFPSLLFYLCRFVSSCGPRRMGAAASAVHRVPMHERTPTTNRPVCVRRRWERKLGEHFSSTSTSSKRSLFTQSGCGRGCVEIETPQVVAWSWMVWTTRSVAWTSSAPVREPHPLHQSSPTSIHKWLRRWLAAPYDVSLPSDIQWWSCACILLYVRTPL